MLRVQDANGAILGPAAVGTSGRPRYHRVRTSIPSTRLGPGNVLDEHDIAGRPGISRMVARRALPGRAVVGEARRRLGENLADRMPGVPALRRRAIAAA